MRRHEHDCCACTYLGHVEVGERPGWHLAGSYDLYVCPQAGLPTVILRYGPDAEYTSGGHLLTSLPEPQRSQAAALFDDFRSRA